MEIFLYAILRDFFINLICYRIGRLVITLVTFGNITPKKLSVSQVEFKASSLWVCFIGFITLIIISAIAVNI
jgi:hypothetical protein